MGVRVVVCVHGAPNFHLFLLLSSFRNKIKTDLLSVGACSRFATSLLWHFHSFRFVSHADNCLLVVQMWMDNGFFGWSRQWQRDKPCVERLPSTIVWAVNTLHEIVGSVRHSHAYYAFECFMCPKTRSKKLPVTRPYQLEYVSCDCVCVRVWVCSQSNSVRFTRRFDMYTVPQAARARAREKTCSSHASLIL